MATDQDSESYSESETEARREAALKRMLATPHKPHNTLDGKSRKDSNTPAAPRAKKLS